MSREIRCWGRRQSALHSNNVVCSAAAELAPRVEVESTIYPDSVVHPMSQTWPSGVGHELQGGIEVLRRLIVNPGTMVAPGGSERPRLGTRPSSIPVYVKPAGGAVARSGRPRAATYARSSKRALA